ncbi:hypothetical protein CEXT_787931 [Caerostris extrusa]|uniref:Uncharacterized protein n=1 Tax=Caerostris extrusa TaxID=172846 RepID=A0AAV4N5F6_CAEEX|nr:hypothetical protein CEXT_787931 [Caerostris extrusa]
MFRLVFHVGIDSSLKLFVPDSLPFKLLNSVMVVAGARSNFRTLCSDGPVDFLLWSSECDAKVRHYGRKNIDHVRVRPRNFGPSFSSASKREWCPAVIEIDRVSSIPLMSEW